MKQPHLLRGVAVAAALLIGAARAQDIKAPNAPSVNFQVLPAGAIWVKPGLFKVPNYQNSGQTLWIEVSGKTTPLFSEWAALSTLTPIKVSTATISSTPEKTASKPEPVTVTAPAPAPAPAPVAVSAPAPAPVTVAAPAPAPVATPTTPTAPVAETPAAAPEKSPAKTTKTSTTPAEPTKSAADTKTNAQADAPVAEPSNITASTKTPEQQNAAQRDLPPTTPTRVALMAASKGVVVSNLPAWASVQFFMAPGKAPGTLTIGYTFNNTDAEFSLITDANKITIKQGDRLLSARLDRRNTSQQVGFLGPKTGEFGTISVMDATPEPLVLSWEMQGTAGEGTYTVTITWAITEAIVR